METFGFQIKRTGTRIEVGRLPGCFGDELQVEQVFSNLVANSLKYLSPDRLGVIKISGRREGNYSIYCVQDNGVGIESDNLDKIFRMFYRVNSGDNGGEGLGLAIVRKIILRHNGTVWAESEPGVGSKFFVSLPSREPGKNIKN